MGQTGSSAQLFIIQASGSPVPRHYSIIVGSGLSRSRQIATSSQGCLNAMVVEDSCNVYDGPVLRSTWQPAIYQLMLLNGGRQATKTGQKFMGIERKLSIFYLDQQYRKSFMRATPVSSPHPTSKVSEIAMSLRTKSRNKRASVVGTVSSYVHGNACQWSGGPIDHFSIIK